MNRPPAWWSFLPSIVNLYINEPINYNASGRYIYIFHDYSIFYFVYNRIFSDGSTLYRQEGGRGSQQGERYVTIIMSHNFYIKIVKMWQILLTDWLTGKDMTQKRERGGPEPQQQQKPAAAMRLQLFWGWRWPHYACCIYGQLALLKVALLFLLILLYWASFTLIHHLFIRF